MYPYPMYPIESGPGDPLQVLVAMIILVGLIGAVAGFTYWYTHHHHHHKGKGHQPH
jgi:hypothetical protein